MPHCSNCSRFYPTTWKNGCVHCNPKTYVGPYCDHCQVIMSKGSIKEFDEKTGEALRPNCPRCGQGPMVPSHAEVIRREKGKAVVLAEAEIKPMLKKHTALKAGESGIAEIGLARGLTATTLFFKSPEIEAFFKKAVENEAHPDGYCWMTGRAGTPYENMKGYEGDLIELSNGARVLPWRFMQKDYSIIPTSTPSLGTGRSDLSFLRVVGLKDGIEIAIPGVFSSDLLTKTVDQLTESVGLFYAEAMTPFEAKVEIVTKKAVVGRRVISE